MKKIFLMCLMFSYSYGYANPVLTTPKKIELLIKVWGYIKYFHAGVEKNRLDWDEAFLAETSYLMSVKTTDEEFNLRLTALIAKAGNVDIFPVKEVIINDTCNYNTCLKWIKDSFLLPKLSKELENIAVHSNPGIGKFVGRQRNNKLVPEFYEKPYINMPITDIGYRLLALARYWNIIEYFFPYKYITDQNWDDVLCNAIPEFTEANNEISYVRALSKLISKVNDSHANLIGPKQTAIPFYSLPVKVEVVEDKAVITELINDSMSRAVNLAYGDAILSVNDTSARDWINYKSIYISASNQAVVDRKLAPSIIFGRNKVVKFSIERNGMKFTNYITRTTPLPETYNNPSTPWKKISPTVGYIDLRTLKRKQVKRALSSMRTSKSIIFDLRGYPNWTLYPICNYLSKEKTGFAKFTIPNLACPGTFNCTPIFTFGKRQDHGFHGKIIILINEQTQSQAEFTAMALRNLPNSICIGSQTAGSDGNVTTLILPGNYSVLMTCLGVYYPDGKPTQRVGIRPDIYVNKTVTGIRNHKDEILERAIQVALEDK